MRSVTYIFFLGLISMTFGSCEQPEKPVQLPPASGQLFTFNMGTDYSSQMYVSLENGIVGSFPNESWDLAFDCGPANYIQINGGNNALIAFASHTSFLSKIDFADLTWHWDEACGLTDSLVLTNWQNRNDSVFIIDRGIQYKGAERYFQFKLEATNAAYKLTMADATGQNIKEHLITKDANKKLVYFSFANGGAYKNIEPDKATWDLCFLKYRWIYYEFSPPLLYTVVGTYINTDFLHVAFDSVTSDYDKVEATDFDHKVFSNERDVIGYDWKVPVFGGTSVTYRTRNYITYFIRKSQPGQSNHLYKLRFIDFYDDKGNKGAPAFEVKRLK